MSPRTSSDEPTYEVKIRFRLGEEFHERVFKLTDRRLYPEAKRWNYVVRNRERLTDLGREGTARAEIARLAEIFAHGSDEQSSPLDLDALVRDLARAGVVEISFPAAVGGETGLGYAARVFPWEMVITFVTWPYRAPGQRLTIVRHLEVRSSENGAPQPPQTLLALSSAPGKVAELFNLSGECRLVAAILGLNPARESSLIEQNLDAGELTKRVATGKPDIIHLAGVDPYWLDASGLMPQQRNAGESDSSFERRGRDGLVLVGRNTTYDPVDPHRLAEILTAGEHRPRFVAVSTCYSGRRVAPRIVAAGAHASIGFHDTVTDPAAEAFFGAFYRRWRGAGWPHPGTVFPDALREAAEDPSLNFTGGVVLWSSDSVFDAQPMVLAVAPQAAVEVAAVDLDPVRDLEVIFKNVSTLNYSLLHNRKSLFDEFRVRKLKPGRLPNLTVEVSLDTGGGCQPCRFTCELPEKAESVNLIEEISTPLIAPLLRGVSESLRTNLYLKVTCDGKIIRETTRPITILPVDEWRDDGKDHCWLPSFVLPRDSAVLKVMTSALRYLRAIADDPQAGFSGYQGIDPDGANAADIVDPQVRSIWAALQHEFRLAYINPPPSYTLRSQRLRSPSQILEGGSATCIDLALLFAACLEYIGVCPVVFLIQGHAFPGYWRDDRKWLQLQEVIGETEEVVSQPSDGFGLDPTSPMSSGQNDPGRQWMLSGIESFPALAGYVRAQSLMPFESTFVTANRSFAEALVQGRDNLQPRTFDAMIDVSLARKYGVTPLPILES